jgi:TolB-like protein/Flp pilus assembly protein TadD
MPGRFWPLAVLIVLVIVTAWAAYRHFVPSWIESAAGRKMLVVLPFENLGAPEDEYFADGITEEITSRLASVGRLGVISRTSSVQYAQTGKSIEQIGRELGVEYVLEGTVRWARDPAGRDRVRITPQLIRVDDDTHLWADTYDRVIEDIFAVQSDIAQKVVEQLGITLLEAERPGVEMQLTDNLQAYHAYLRGRYYAGQPHFTLENSKRVIENYQHAVEIDPNFALAHAELSKEHSRLFYYRHDLSDERKALARSAVDKAVELAPESPEVRLAVGLYQFRVEKDFEQALESFELAAADRPDSDEILDAKAEMLRHQGRWQEASDYYRKACELSPRNADHFVELALTNWWMRRYPEALALCEEAITLAPDQAWSYLGKVFNYWSWNGALDEAREALEMVPEGHSWASWTWYWQRMFEGKYREALKGLSSAPGEWIKLKIGAWPKSLLGAYAYECLGEEESARRSYEDARIKLEREVLETPDDPRYHSSLGVACAALGRKEQAIREGKRAVEIYPISADAVYGQPYVIDLAHIYTILEEHEAALEQLEDLLSIHGWMSVAWIEVDPRWNSLREDPGYLRLLNDYSGHQE